MADAVPPSEHQNHYRRSEGIEKFSAGERSGEEVRKGEEFEKGRRGCFSGGKFRRR